MSRIFIQIFIITLLILTICFISYKFDNIRPDNELQKFLYLAKNNEVKSFAFGFEAEYADILWMLSIQAFHRHCLEKIPFTEANHVYKSIRLLDPQFVGMYETAPFFISIVEKKSSPGVNFIKEATEQKDPVGAKYPEKEYLRNQPWIWHMLSRAYWLERINMEKKENIPVEESMKKAILALQKALDLSNNLWNRPFPEAEILLKFMVSKDKGFAFDILTWLDIYERSSENELLRDLVKTKIRDIIVRIHLDHIQEIIDESEKQPEKIREILKSSPREPKLESMPQVIQKIISIVAIASKSNQPDILNVINENIKAYVTDGMKKDFTDGEYYFWKEDEQLVTSIDNERKKLDGTLYFVQKLIEKFRSRKGRWPSTLEELVENKYISELPKLPLDKEYNYDSIDGVLSYIPE